MGFLLRICEPEALRQSLGGEGDQLARLVPELAQLTGTPAEPSGDPEADRYLLQTTATGVLTRMSRVRPLLLVVDDLHWSDTETLYLLRRLARTAPETRMVVVAAFRDPGEEIGPALADALADLSRLDAVTRLRLRGLSAEEVSAFIRASADAEATPELASHLGKLTAGTPLLLCELWRDLRESGSVEVLRGSVQLSRPLGEARGSERVREFVRQRLSRVPPETRAVVETAAVVGPRFELGVLGEAAGLEPAPLLDRLDEAAGAGLLEALPEPLLAWRFTHELLRRAVYDRLKAARRADLHLRVGEALEHAHSADPSRVLPELAHHFTLAAPLAGIERAVDYNLRAAEAAIASLAYGEAAARLSSALELGIGDPRERASVQSELGVLLFETGRIVESEAILAASLEAATGIGEQGLKTRVVVQLAWDRMNSDPGVDSREIQTVAENAIEVFGELGDSLGLAMAEGLVGFALRSEGRVGESLGALERALVHADASRDQAMRRRVIGTLGRALCEGPARVDEAIHRCEELLELSGGDRGLEAQISRFLAALFAMAARFDESREHVGRGGSLLDVLNISWLDVEAMELAGDRAGAVDEAAEASRHFRDRGGGALDTRALGRAARLALLYCDEGRWDDAADCLAYGRDLPEPIKFRPSAVLRLAAQARIASHRGESAEPLRLAQRAVELAEGSDFLNHRARVWLALAEVQRRNGETAEAGAAAAAALRLYQTKGNVAAAARLQAAHAAAPS
jgi:tetratricopeptide (TPR) repeat protein